MPKHSNKIGGGFYTGPNRRIRQPVYFAKRREQAKLTREDKQAIREAKLKEELEAKAEREKKEAEEREAAEKRGPSKKALKRMKKKELRLKAGKLVQTDHDVKKLMRRYNNPQGGNVIFTVLNAMDEVELRNSFAYQGTAGGGAKFFSASRYYFRFLLAKDGTPVAQIVEKDTLQLKR